MKILVLHGPNLNRLGAREPEIYGHSTLEDVNQLMLEEAARLGMTLDIHQTAREGEIIERLHAGLGDVAGAVLNPAAYSHTSRAIAEAVASVDFPVVEVHLSNIHAREPWRRRSVTAESARGLISGFGPGSYVLGLHALKRLLGK